MPLTLGCSVDDANNLAASLLLLARGGSDGSCEKTIGDDSAARWMRCGPNLGAGDGLLQGLSVHKKEGGWQSLPASSSLPPYSARKAIVKNKAHLQHFFLVFSQVSSLSGLSCSNIVMFI